MGVIMQGFTSTELANNTGDVLMAAAGGPVEITRHGKPQFVLMTQALYTQLLARNGMEPEEPAMVEPVDLAKAPNARQVKPASKTAKKAKRKKKKTKETPEANANAALELMQALQSWSDD